MSFKNYLQDTQNINEGIIVPPKLNIKTLDIKKLNKQFQNTIISFQMSDGGAHASYVPENEEIIVYLDADGGMDFNTLEALIQHEIIHSTQDQKSGMRMADAIQKDFKKLRILNAKVASCEDGEELCPVLIKDYKNLIAKMDFLNHEEEMAYAYMYAKMYKSLSIKDVLKKMADEWVGWTNKSPSKRMMKYFGSYWMIKDDL
ncbi:MAG: hypothetical protein J7L15_06160 [Clostridiales bacterium]|nr:hypothetical protein [Clostridiales bacterium]